MRLLSLRLVDGTEVLGYRLEEDTEYLHIVNALIVSYRFVEGNPLPLVYLQKYSPYTYRYTVKFAKTAIVSLVENLEPEVEKYYEQILRKIKDSFKVVFVDDEKGESGDEFDDYMDDYYDYKGEVH